MCIRDRIKTFKMKSGLIDKDVICEEKLSELSKLPSREVLLATVLSAFNAPIAAFAMIKTRIQNIKGNLRIFVDYFLIILIIYSAF